MGFIEHHEQIIWPTTYGPYGITYWWTGHLDFEHHWANVDNDPPDENIYNYIEGSESERYDLDWFGFPALNLPKNAVNIKIAVYFRAKYSGNATLHAIHAAVGQFGTGLGTGNIEITTNWADYSYEWTLWQDNDGNIRRFTPEDINENGSFTFFGYNAALQGVGSYEYVNQCYCKVSWDIITGSPVPTFFRSTPV